MGGMESLMRRRGRSTCIYEEEEREAEEERGEEGEEGEED